MIGNPVMVWIGNGYLPNGGYSRIMRMAICHWITIWGYDDEKKVFYVYDSAVPKNHHDVTVPIGNVKRTYNEMLRDWSGAWLPRLWGFTNYQYIEISLQK
ncbi:hypothetical protein CO051_01830 [Candidatus Roizmanbacteria bacterium CG_4_9_14_0_2_um_filter_39_13]|uniref:Peptidase C39-like domain-containing protein n=1 Tax=Candidatus Roizmanbacteria bacterium CG_4_9_14_0_2_um_filter_39_13 TaxID=1974839 RepID=A0A2M8F1S1_9BACT|nr:MAG: hypothetical protein CO051_01830 [Candidatus Roizmanbacteria bacterium CG_4_9_14_0_2_um_filter_39_13]